MTDRPDTTTGNDPHWGAENRDRKAANIVTCLELLTDLDLSAQSCVDIGCGSGGISFHLAPHFRTVCGVDPEPWQRWQDFIAERDNLSFQQGSGDSLGFAANSIDVTICNQVYEHVPSPQDLIAEIHRVLRPGGVCYFAGPNLLFPIEPHVFWPFIHWIPRRWALAILRVFAPEKEKILDAYSATIWTLKRWFVDFEVEDAVPALVGYHARNSGGIWTLFRPIPAGLLRFLGFLSPGFVFILTKPGKS